MLESAAAFSSSQSDTRAEKIFSGSNNKMSRFASLKVAAVLAALAVSSPGKADMVDAGGSNIVVSGTDIVLSGTNTISGSISSVSFSAGAIAPLTSIVVIGTDIVVRDTNTIGGLISSVTLSTGTILPTYPIAPIAWGGTLIGSFSVGPPLISGPSQVQGVFSGTNATHAGVAYVLVQAPVAIPQTGPVGLLVAPTSAGTISIDELAFASPAVAPVPVPQPLALLVTGLACLFIVLRMRFVRM
jgi:hypothetical protein